MESLALLVVILLIVLALAAPLAYWLSKYKPRNFILKIIKRLIQAAMLLSGFVVATVFLFSSMPPLLRSMGLVVEVIVYLTLRREYFPQFKFRVKIRQILSGKNKKKDENEDDIDFIIGL